MARTVTLFKIFVASPSDLKDERTLIEEVIDELNLSTFNNTDIKIELKKWETHANPDIGDYPQQVINRDISDDYDIFIGLLWSKFGTQTRDYGSGTEEEFYNAYSLHKKLPSSIKIMFYFKQAAIPFEKIDTDSINSIRKFRSKISSEGVLFWDYNTIEEFQKLIRIQLTRKIQELRADETTSNYAIDKEEKEKTPLELEEDLGLLDYVELGEESFQNIEDILLRVTDAIEWLGKRFTEGTEEINKQISIKPELGNKAKKRLVNSVANDMHSFNKRLSVEIPLFAETYRRGIDSFSNAIKISISMKAEEKNDIEDAINSIDSSIESILETKQEFILFRDSMIEFPRMTKEFNQVRRLSASILQELISEFEIAANLSKALRNEFDEYNLIGTDL